LMIELGFFVSRSYVDSENMPPPEALPQGYSNTKELGRVLYTDYVYAFEIAAVILLVAIVATIALTLRRRKSTKGMDPGLQVKVRREDRVRIVSMPPVRPEEATSERKDA
ncbi:MAG: NADH:ubiquinone oxidoreductase subunit, partial [Ramlibacter sp.]|nr:NADH:ubiquinone oxidoreductase subunit [Ramlibacter sp.]